MSQYSAHTRVMMKAAINAAKGLIRDFGEVEQLQISKKGPGDFVSIADKRSEETLIQELQKARPTYSLISEEHSPIIQENAPYRWVIDPLDGTTNFLHGIPFFCISIALVKILPNGNEDIEAAVIHAPILGETFWADKGGGAWIERHNSTHIRESRLRVSSRKSLEESLISTGCLQQEGHTMLPLCKTLQSNVAGIRALGSTALSLAYVAAGRLDGVFGITMKEWDTAAGILLIKEAGGISSTLGGDTSIKEVLSGQTLLSSTAELHEKLQRILLASQTALE